MYSFTDRELAEELVRLARSGVRVRVYRDSRESMQENQRGSSTTEALPAVRWRLENLARMDATKRSALIDRLRQVLHLTPEQSP